MVMLPEAKLYIDGVVRGAAGGKTYDVINPWTGDVVGHAADGSAEDVNAAIAAARRAFDETDWSTNHKLRFDLVVKFRDALLADKAKLADLAQFEAGSAKGALFAAQVDGAIAGVNALIDL